MKNKTPELKSFQVSLDGEHWEIINALSRGQAKSNYHSACDFDVPYTYVKCRSYGNIHTSEDFIQMAKYRKIEFAYCGMSVNVKDVGQGVIISHNSSSNLNVMFIEGKYKNQVLNCHPHNKITYYNKKGEVIKQFN